MALLHPWNPPLVLLKYCCGFYDRELLFDNEGNLLKEGTNITNEKYAATLKEIRDNPYSMYHGPLAKKIIRDLKNVTPNGLLEMDDLRRYTVKFQKGFPCWLNSHRVLYTTPPPTSGVLLNLILNILKGMLSCILLYLGTNHKVLGGGWQNQKIERPFLC
ncbi:MAG: gamma-glutamyltransferase [Acidobacteriota bacterium]